MSKFCEPGFSSVFSRKWLIYPKKEKRKAFIALAFFLAFTHNSPLIYVLRFWLSLNYLILSSCTYYHFKSVTFQTETCLHTFTVCIYLFSIIYFCLNESRCGFLLFLKICFNPLTSNVFYRKWTSCFYQIWTNCFVEANTVDL